MREDLVIDGKMDAFTQLHVARKLSPAMPLVLALNDPENADKPKAMLVITLLSYISDEDSEFVINKCLSLVKRRQEKGFVKIMAANNVLAFHDITMDDISELVGKVVVDNLGDFLNTALAK